MPWKKNTMIGAVTAAALLTVLSGCSEQVAKAPEDKQQGMSGMSGMQGGQEGMSGMSGMQGQQGQPNGTSTQTKQE